MTFLEALNKLEPNELVYIGAKSSFILIDTKENILGKLDELEDELHKNAEHILNHHNKNMFRIPNDLEDLTYEHFSAVDKEDKIEIKKLQDRIIKLTKAYVNSIKGYAKYDDYLKHWVEFKDREVLDMYPHTVDNPGTTILVKGLEQGDLWWRNEK